MKMKSCKFLSFVALLLLCSLAVQAQKVLYSLDFKLSKKDFVDTIPITQERERVLVPVSLGGQSCQFLLDTGASHAVIYDDAMIEGCEPIGEIDSYDANNHKAAVPMVMMPPLTIGSLTLTGCHATVQKRRIKDRPIDGIIGFDLVSKGLQMKIDTREKMLIITDRKKFFDNEPGYKLKYSMQRHVPYIEVSPFSQYKETVLFDTGSNGIYVINKGSLDTGEPLMVNRSQIEGRSMGRMSMGFSGTEARGEVVFLALDSLSVGGFFLKDLHTHSTQGNSHVGAGIMKYGAVVFVPHKKVMVFQPYDDVGSCEVGNRQIEKAVVPSADGLPMIGVVWERSEAFLAGFREGDIIVKADGKPISSFQEYRRFRPINQHVYTFDVIDRRGFTKEVKAEW